MSVRSIHKAVNILLQFSPQEPQLGVVELSRRLNMPTSTVQRLLATLEEQGLCEQDRHSRKFHLGPMILRLAGIALRVRDLRSVAVPIMVDLRDETNETVHLNVVRGNQRVLIERVDGFQELRAVTEIGQPSPLHCGASARALLAYLPSEYIEQFLQETLVRCTPDSPVEAEHVQQLLKEVRTKGYAFSRGERVQGVITFSAPVRDHQNQVAASLSISMPAVRYDPSRHTDFANRLLDSAGRLSAALGSA